jgi:hypothetical protein
MSFTYFRRGKLIYLESIFPIVPKKAYYEIISFRNEVISRYSGISLYDPDRTPGPDRYPENVDTWFPVVDIEIDPGMYAQATVSDDYTDVFYFNSFMNFEPVKPENKTGTIDGRWLLHWENSLYMLSKTSTVTRFGIYKEVPVIPTISRRLNTTVTALTEDWGGTIRSWYIDGSGSPVLLGEITVETPVSVEKPKQKPQDVLAGMYESLNLCIGYILGSQNKCPISPQKDGLYLFYDLDAKTYRQGQWPWSWGAAIKLLLDSSHLDPDLINYSPDELREAAWKIGNASLRFQIINPDHTAHLFGTTRYTVRTNEKTGYQELVNTGSDAGFLAGWGWIPLYGETGDSRFLEAAKNYIDVLVPVLTEKILPPQEWLPAQNNWTDFTIDESGFGTEGINGCYQATKETRYRSICELYINKHIAIFERADYLWDRQYHFSSGITDPTRYMTRGLGWAMEGLLASYRATQNRSCLDKAANMGKVLINAQQCDGSWPFQFDKTPADVGTADKGTSLWCLLLYMLYKETHDPAALDSATKALKWCILNQYAGSDSHAYGGIVSRSAESGITYRSWFDMCCQYTSAFFGLALIEELKLGREPPAGIE